MKVIVAGATGFVATEVIRQALSIKSITSLVALARRETPIPKRPAADADASKFKSVICEDFGNYSDSVKSDLADADAVIWLIAITPAKSRSYSWPDVCKICQDYTMTGLETLPQLRSAKTSPLRFIYTSGSNAVRDPNQKPYILGNYSVMRGDVENKVLDYAKQSEGRVESYVIKPGLIGGAEDQGMVMGALQFVRRTLVNNLVGVPLVNVPEVAASLLSLAINGSDKDTLLNEDLIQTGQKVLAEGHGSPE